ncbi:SDR family NAD(P)-dependent oxidoreductase [Noviherbaspirillum sp. CPCC 100848]|uniref:SDR family NAD(P)-dependent oxidoreductase n=1 Tax=Noviherbaspirillum album TaxID=3080276 RepID=A0ABU6J8X2_9BURK|nr:SDR family NAD(P)-dependent oxidoreductase [Noviherbaspirillum sp. CPCC 100848]MEC4720092.1 SDR family NAD(P)-dependent oxidoreductase [Noviherbaspirillum sp. CPCC 100848]
MQHRNHYDFSGRHAVITGGAAGIGLAIAQRLAEGGASVSLWDRDAEALEHAIGRFDRERVHTAVVDVAGEQSVAEARDATLARFGKVDVLVTSAGITGPNMSVADYPPEEWDRVMNINLRGPFLCCRALVPHMREKDYGRIVNIASIAGKEGNPNASAYSASKAGVIALTKSLGKELAQTGIRVNCITPAAVRTGMFAQMTQQHIDYMLSKIPMSRFGTVEEVAALVAWLASAECSFSTAAVFDVSGGRGTY